MMMLKSRTISLLLLAGVVLAGTPLFAQRGGRGAPSLPPQSQVPAERFPGFPDNAGIGQPADIGQPATLPPDQPDPRAASTVANGGTPELTASEATATEQLARTPELAGRLAGILRVDSLTTEPDGFRNLGLFVAAVQVSDRVDGTTFEGLKTHMLEGDGMSLGEAIQAETALSEAEAAEAAADAEEAAAEVIEETS